MSFETVQLPAHLINELYRNYLIENNLQNPDTDHDISHDIPHLGKNNKGILILVNNPDLPYVDDDDLSFLTNILKACDLTLADVALVNFGKDAAMDHVKLNTRFAPTVVMLLGVEPANIDLPLLFPHFQVQQFSGCTYLAAPSLREIAADKEIKKPFWNALQRIFKS